MKIRLSLSALLVLLILGGTATAQSQNQSLGDYARAVKKTKTNSSTQTPKVFDNDNLSVDGQISVVGKPASTDSDTSKDQAANSSTDATSSDAKKADAKDAKSDKKDEPQLKPGQSTEEHDVALEAVKKKLDAQKEKVDLLSRELDVMNREHDIKVAEFYQDSNRVADPNSFYEGQAKYKEQLEEKQKALDAAKAELSDMQDEARRNGAPNSMLE